MRLWPRPSYFNLKIGSLVVLAAVHWERSGRGLVPLACAGAAAMAFKSPKIIVVVAVAAYLAIRGLVAGKAAGEPRKPRGQGCNINSQPRLLKSLFSSPSYLIAAGSLLGGAAIVSIAWLVVRSALAIPGVVSPIMQSFSRSSIGLSQFSENLGAFVTVWLNRTWDPAQAPAYPLAFLISCIIIGSLIATLAECAWRERRHSLALVTGTMIVVGPLLLVAATFVTTGIYFRIEPRYGATLVPLQCVLAACLAWAPGADLCRHPRRHL